MKKVFVIGIGPGDEKNLTVFAKEALEQSDYICGYTVYVDLVKFLYPQKPVISTGMRQEVQRCELALQTASENKIVSVICSGDSGVYGMASLVYELWANNPNYSDVEIEIVSGVTAATSGSAVLGAALSHDFALVSLSDLLTPWELIEKRLHAVSSADFCIAIYNPCSKKRNDYLQKACDIILQYKKPETVCGWVRNIGRDGEEYRVLTLGELKDEQLDMFSTVFIGNEYTKILNGKMVTPRGYKIN